MTEEVNKIDLSVFNLLAQEVLPPINTGSTITKPLVNDLKVGILENSLEIPVKDPIVEEVKEEVIITEETSIIESVEEEGNEFTVFGSILAEKGTIEVPEGMIIDSEDKLEDAVAFTIEKYVTAGVEGYKDSFTEEGKKVLDFLEKGGDINKYLDTRQKANNNVTLEQVKEDEDLQKNYVRRWLEIQGYDKEEIDSKIEKYDASGLLEDEAEGAFKKVKKSIEAEETALLKQVENTQEENKQKYAEYLKNLNTSIETKEEIAGFKVSSKQKKEFFEYITKPIDKSGKTALMKANEEDPEAQLKMAWLYFNKFDFNKLEKKVATQVTSKLKEKLNNYSDSREKLSASKIHIPAKPTDLSIARKILNSNK